MLRGRKQTRGGIIVLITDGENNVMRNGYDWPDVGVSNNIVSQNVKVISLSVGQVKYSFISLPIFFH